MKVKAIRKGFYGEHFKEVGAVFELDKAEDMSCLWMKPLDAEAQKAYDQKKLIFDSANLPADQRAAFMRKAQGSEGIKSMGEIVRNGPNAEKKKSGKKVVKEEVPSSEPSKDSEESVI